MENLFANGLIIDAILIMVLIEGILIWLWHRITGRGLPLAAVLPLLTSGFLLLLAVRAALVQAPWPLVALPLTAALATHIADLIRRWPRARDR